MAVAALAAVAISACQDLAEAPKAAKLPTPAAVDASVIRPQLRLEVRYMAPDGNTPLMDFSLGAPPIIERTYQLQISANVALRNFRIRLFDEIDRAMVSNDELEDLGERVRYRIDLPTPLMAGHSYTLVLDAATGSAVSDADGRVYPDQRLEFDIVGTREPDRPEPKASRGGRRR